MLNLETGNAMRLYQDKIETFYSLYNVDTDNATKSIAKIIRIPGVQYIFTTHSGYINSFKKAIED